MARPPPTESPPLFAHARSLTTTPPDDGWESSQPKRTQRRGKPAKPTKEVSTMKQEVRTAFAAATAANAAAQFARTAENLARVSPSEWELVDQAYWLCRAAGLKAEAAADALNPEWADLDETVTYAHATANGAAQLANEAADDLVSLAEANNHTIRR